MTARRILAVVLAVVTVGLFAWLYEGRGGDTTEPDLVDMAALSVSSCGGLPVDVIDEQSGQVYCQPDQAHGSTDHVNAGEMVGRLWWVLALAFVIVVMLGMSSLWNGRPG